MSRLGVELHVPELLYVWLFLQVINSYSSWQGRHKKKKVPFLHSLWGQMKKTCSLVRMREV